MSFLQYFKPKVVLSALQFTRCILSSTLGSETSTLTHIATSSISSSDINITTTAALPADYNTSPDPKPTSDYISQSSYPPSLNLTAVTLVHAIVTNFAYEPFCSSLLGYTGTVSIASTFEFSTATGTLSLTFIDVTTKVVYTCTSTVYASTKTYTIEASSSSRRRTRMPPTKFTYTHRDVPTKTPLLLATFDLADLSAGCLVAVPARETSTAYNIVTVTVPYESIDLAVSTTRLIISTATPTTVSQTLTVIHPTKGYWKIFNESLVDLHGRYLSIDLIDPSNSTLGGYLTLTEHPYQRFEMVWDHKRQVYYVCWMSGKVFSDGWTATVEYLWLSYHTTRNTMDTVRPMFLEETVADQLFPNETRKAKFVMAQDGYITPAESEPVIFTCRDFAIKQPGADYIDYYMNYTFWWNTSEYRTERECIWPAVSATYKPMVRVLGCVVISDSVAAYPGFPEL
ncbi:hypothetical protein TWF718_010422 [Orbilia javanica]|uniref:Uncharacterized protein n=1 Tax=Orbilia javanica TaxID=47235 RepID=A0AAN8MUE1_9PEZI